MRPTELEIEVASPATPELRLMMLATYPQHGRKEGL